MDRFRPLPFAPRPPADGALSASTGSALGVPEQERTQRLRLALVVAVSLVAALLGGLAIGVLPTAYEAAPFAIAALFLVALLFWYRRAAPPVVFVLAATLIDRYDDPTAWTARLPFWRSVGSTHIFPIEVLLVMALLFWLLRDLAVRRFNVPRSHVAAGMGALLALALLAWAHGLASGGDSQIALQEVRPWLYLVAAFLLASQLLRGQAAFTALEWALVIGTGLKGIYGTYRFHQLANVYPPPDSILEHDESVFFTVYILLTVALWVFGRRGALRRVATALLPFVVIADVGNNRRTAWLVLPAALLMLAAVAYVRKPQSRRLTVVVTATLVLIGGAYVAAFHNSTSSKAAPAHAIWSAFQPDPRDEASNNYRTLENDNLAIDIKQAMVQGLGFGVRFPTPIPMVDVSGTIDPLIFYIPHDTVLWVWLRMGLLGMLALWWTAGAAIIAASRVARGEDGRLALVATVAAGAVICWLGQGWLDQGIASLRIAALMGVLIGAVEAARVMLPAPAAEPAPASVGAPRSRRTWRPLIEPVPTAPAAIEGGGAPRGSPSAEAD
jgi:O-Antigen ligase